MLHGIDPYTLLTQGRVDHLIHIALLEKAIELDGTRKLEEYKVLAQLVGLETAKIISKIF